MIQREPSDIGTVYGNPPSRRSQDRRRRGQEVQSESTLRVLMVLVQKTARRSATIPMAGS